MEIRQNSGGYDLKWLQFIAFSNLSEVKAQKQSFTATVRSFQHPLKERQNGLGNTVSVPVNNSH